MAPVPSGHPYVQALASHDVRLLPDPPVPGAPPGTWWPPEVLSRAWIERHAGQFDLVHVHFGTESLSIERLAGALEALRELGRPLVHTVHDLDHPHLTDQAHHDERLALLVAASAELLTLTDRAADVVERRFGRRPTVVPHPQLAAEHWFARADGLRVRERPGPVVGVHLRSLRANIRPGAWFAELAATVAARGGVLRLVVNDGVQAGTPEGDALDGLVAAAGGVAARDGGAAGGGGGAHGGGTAGGGGGAHDGGTAGGGGGAHDGRSAIGGAGPAVEVLRRPRPDDDGLARELADLDVAVLPYAHGTHSGWLELCWDLGVRTLTPDVGAIADQHREAWAVATFDGGDPATVGPALDRLLAAPGPPPAAERLAERRRVLAENRAVHAALYARVLRAAARG